MPKEPKLSYLSTEDRLKAYQLITAGCHHLYSKNKFQEEKALKVLEPLVRLGYDDPYFLAHLTSWSISQDSKDLTIMSIFANALSSANGMPFSLDSKYKKPNLRVVSVAAIQEINPKLANRALQLSRWKFGIDGLLNVGRHFPQSLERAFEKYLKYRECHLDIVRGIKKAGLGRMYQNMYRTLHMKPKDVVCSILRWGQKGKKIKFEKPVFDFKKMTPQEIAKKIRKDKLPVLGVIGALPKMTPVVAVALLEQASGDQAIILRKAFEDQGVLKDKEVLELFNRKIGEAKNAIDRVKSFAHKTSKEVREGLKTAKSKVRKKATKDIGKIFIYLDLSPSMEKAIEVAKTKGAMIAEMVNNPEENFAWGTFNDGHEILPNPKEFVEDAFKAVLFGKRCSGMTNAFLLYPKAREHKADVDILITDGCQNRGNLTELIKKYHVDNPDVPKPKAMVWVNVFDPHGMGYVVSEVDSMKNAYEQNDIPVAKLNPETLNNSALIVSAVKASVQGPKAIIEEIMATKLLELPDYYFTI